MKRVKMDIPDKIGTWQGPVTKFNYVVPTLNKIILIYDQDRQALCEQYGNDKLPVI